MPTAARLGCGSVLFLFCATLGAEVLNGDDDNDVIGGGGGNIRIETV